MLFLRIYNGIREHFPSRVPEWALGLYIINYGLGLGGTDGGGWTSAAAWHGMTQYMPQPAWGTVCVLIGTLRLLALAINGTFADTFYARWSPFVRGLCALASATFWLMVVLSLSAVPTVGVRAYLLPLGLEIWCIGHAMRDDGRQRSRNRKRGVA